MNGHAGSDVEAVNWQARGYFAYPNEVAPSRHPIGTPMAASPLYPAWIDTLDRARGGDFSTVTELLRMANGHIHPVIQRLCEDLVGDAGTTVCFDHVAAHLRTDDLDCEQIIGWCSVLTRRGKLADMPVVLDAFEKIVDIDDAEIIPVKISECLEAGYTLADHTGHPSFQQYRDAVLTRCNELADHLGTDQALVVAGQRLSIPTLAERILDRLREPHFPTFLRRVFESSTGIDCATFYRDGRLQPLNAAALMESFLASSRSQAFEDGVRYFFGHRVP